MKTTIKNIEILKLHSYFSSLDGSYRGKDGAGNAVFVPFSFGDDGLTDLAIQKNLYWLGKLKAELDSVQTKLIKAAIKPGETKMDQTSSEAIEANKKWEALLQKEQEFELRQFSYSSLNQQENHIPHSLLAAIIASGAVTGFDEDEKPKTEKGKK